MGEGFLYCFWASPDGNLFGAMNLQNEETHSANSIDKTEKYQYIY
jgi:hypothetical protein